MFSSEYQQVRLGHRRTIACTNSFTSLFSSTKRQQPRLKKSSKRSMKRAMEKKPPPRSMLKRRRVLPTQKKMLHMTKSNNDPGSPIFLISWKHPSALSIQPSIHKDSITTCLVLLNVFGMLLFCFTQRVYTCHSLFCASPTFALLPHGRPVTDPRGVLLL